MFLENRIVKVSQGYLKGVPAGNPGYTVFKGVPFAKPPIGALRWMPPQAPECWDGIREAAEYAPAAIQVPGKNKGAGLYHKEFKPAEVEESEDCLYLNIWTPNINADLKLPVMFWIHGGGFTNGYCYEMEFDGEAFCKRSCILVTVAYRLGSLGFLAHPELTRRAGGSSGNFAVQDCIAALNWVRENIGAFGGDSSNITVFGQSAGSAMTQALSASPLTKGLFQHAIVQSGGSINTLGNGGTLRDAEAFGVKLLDKIGLSIDELMAMDGKRVNRLLLDAANSIDYLRFAPVVDGIVLSESTGEAFSDGSLHDIDYMTGSVAGDGVLLSGMLPTTEGIRTALHVRYGEYAPRFEALTNGLVESNPQKAASLYIKAGSALAPMAWAKARCKQGLKPIYTYYFDRMMPGDSNGAFHSSELWYIFGTLDRCWRTMEDGFSAGDYALSMLMLDYWTNFAHTGNPNSGPRKVPEWRPFTDANPSIRHFNETLPDMILATDFPLADKMAELMVEMCVKA